MPIQKQAIAITFSGGLETKQDSKQVPTTKLLDLQNATFIKATTLAKRNGYRALGRQRDTNAAVITGTRGLGKRDSELLLFSDDACFSYRPSFDNWSLVGEVASVVATDDPIARTGTAQTIPDIADNGGARVVAWEDSRGGVWCSVVEATTGRILLAQRQLDASGISPRCVAAGTTLLVLWLNVSQGRIWAAIVNPVNPEAIPPSVIVTEDLSKTNPVYDAEPTTLFPTQAPAILVWAQSGGGYRLGYLTGAGVLGSPTNGLPSVATEDPTNAFDGPVCVSSSASTIAVGYCDAGDGTTMNFHTPSSLVRFGTAVVSATLPGSTWARITCGLDGAGVCWWANESQEVDDSARNLIISGQTTAAASPVTSGITTLRGHGLISRAFVDNGQVYAAVAHGVVFFPYVAIVKLSATNGIAGGNTVAVGRLLAGESTGLGIRRLGVGSYQLTRHVSSVLSSGRQHLVALCNRIQLESASGDQFGESGIRIATLDFDHDGAYQTSQLGRNLYLGGAIPQCYDGDKWTEADFHCAPDVGVSQSTGAVQTIATTALASGGLAAGTYGYKFIYEDVDSQGEIHPGAVSVEVNIVVDSDGGPVSIAIPTCRLSNRRAIRIGVFRSPKNQTGDPESIPFYRVSGLDPNVQTGNNRFVANDPTVDTVTFIDNLDDSLLIEREPLYTNGGILSNDPPPMAGDILVGGKSRLYWTDQGDRNKVFFSQELRDDTAAEMPEGNSIRIDPFGGDITGIGTIDGTTIVFKEACIFMFGGPGPDADGGLTSQNAFSPPQLLTSDVGCVAPASITSTPLGVTFQSAKGLKLIGRDLQVTDIGSSVYAYKDQTITRATLLPDRHQVVFLTDAGRTLLFDYEHQQWSTYTNHEGLDAVVVDNVYYYLRTDGRVFQETPGIYKDDNSHIKMVIETAWIKMLGYLQGWQKILRAKFIGAYKSEHVLRVRMRLDYQDGYSTPVDNPVDDNYDPHLYGAETYGTGPYGGALDSGTVYQRSIHINRRCQSISFLIEDVEGTTTTSVAAVAASATLPIAGSGTVVQWNTPGVVGNSQSIQCFGDQVGGVTSFDVLGGVQTLRYTPTPDARANTSASIESNIASVQPPFGPVQFSVKTHDPNASQTFSSTAPTGVVFFSGGAEAYAYTTDNFGAAFELSELLLTGGPLLPDAPLGADRNQ